MRMSVVRHTVVSDSVSVSPGVDEHRRVLQVAWGHVTAVITACAADVCVCVMLFTFGVCVFQLHPPPPVCLSL